MKKFALNLLLFLSTITSAQNAYDIPRALSEINNPFKADAFPTISPDGLRLYYTSGANSNQLVTAARENTDSAFSAPMVLPLVPALITQSQPVYYFISNDELDAYIFLGDLWYAHRNSIQSPFNTPVKLKFSHPFSQVQLSALTLNNALTKLYLPAYDNNVHEYIGMFEFNRITVDSFAYHRTWPNPAGYTIFGGQFSKDELAFYCTAMHTDWRTRLYQLTRTSTADTFRLNTFEEIQGVNDTTLANAQPSVSDNLEWLVFVRSYDGSWERDQLFMAHKSLVTPVFHRVMQQTFVFPNPSNGIFHLAGMEQKTVSADIYNINGEKVFHKSNFSNPEIDLSGKPKGIYFLKLTDRNHIVRTEKLVVE